MFSRVFLICALAFVASAYQIGYQGVQTPEERFGDGYQFYLRLIRAGYPKEYYPYGYASRYYGPAVDQEDIYVQPQEQQVYYPSYYQRYYPEYVSNWQRYPYYARYFQQYQQQYQPSSVYPLSYEKQYQYQQDTPSYYYPSYYYQQYYNRVPYQSYGRGYYYNQYPYYRNYYQGGYTSLLNRILGYQYQPEYVY